MSNLLIHAEVVEDLMGTLCSLDVARLPETIQHSRLSPIFLKIESGESLTLEETIIVLKLRDLVETHFTSILVTTLSDQETWTKVSLRLDAWTGAISAFERSSQTIEET